MPADLQPTFPVGEFFCIFPKIHVYFCPCFSIGLGKGGDPLPFDLMYLEPRIRRAQRLTFTALPIGPRGRQVP
jgi:hypothetical protein